MTKDEQTLEGIRGTFRAMIRRLQADTDAIPDWLIRKAKVAHLEIFLAHSENIVDLDNLVDFCLSVLAEMKRSIDSARFSPRGPSEVLQNDDRANLKSILFAGLYERTDSIV
jgi:hypothetical protein